ncbi:PBSX family phage terminase large subunit [Streptomyces sp. RK23]|uniref:PBSX family phage terminase large subunit n=1 Tax=unclassified Streptomyces TaxID=2593676 RepID=UPI001B37BA43|nr:MULTISPECIES: PBSX family phage terminase large subunit [unclassified Streptomyces]MBQ0969211.1 PBSX family phage terminase large subunit [Streptomyces sp. RK74B]MBQ1004792.1 PBSX family phage terminase large subunit [Streptomyces sp. RK23]
MTIATRARGNPLSLPLSPMQGRSIVQSTARINVWEGSIRSGKTVASLIRWLQFIASAPEDGELVMIGKTIRSVFSNLFTVLTDPKKVGPWAAHVHYVSNAPYATILGRRVHVLGANDSKAEGKLRGITLAGAYLDEATLVSKEFFDQLVGRMSVEGAKLFTTTNPDNPAHWLMRDWLTNPNAPLRRWHFTIEDNPGLNEQYKADIRAMYTGLYYRRFVLGEWVAAEGAVFDMWDPDVHVVDLMPRMHRWVGLGVDYGASNPTAGVLLGLGDDRRLYAVSEYRYDGRQQRRTQTQSETSEAIKVWLSDVPGYGRVRPPFVAVDPSAASFKEQLHRDGLSPVPADNSVLDGIRLVSDLLARNKLFVHRSCRGLISEIPGYSWDDRAALLGEDKPLKVNDHSVDAIRYGAFTTRSQWAHKIGLSLAA